MFSKTSAAGILPKEIKSTFVIQTSGRQSVIVGFVTLCNCTGSSFSLTLPTQLIHIQPPPFRKNSYPFYSDCSSQRCSVNRQPTLSFRLTCAHATLDSASISVCLGCMCAHIPSSYLRAKQAKWPLQLPYAFVVINQADYDQYCCYLV